MAPKPKAADHPTDNDRKILLTIDNDLKTRMITANEHTRAHTGITSQQMFIRTAIAELCTKLEKKYNGGNQFPPPAAARKR
ncbi:hypothetical protein [Rhodococcus qingshengii]|uniref:hypothetical protein n=1 Tax=Rhodococcus qingshengii TaxID=334542 RepID=UPI00287FDF79|nr:hypothetical protein [Rhodococcus qingshengii]